MRERVDGYPADEGGKMLRAEGRGLPRALAIGEEGNRGWAVAVKSAYAQVAVSTNLLSLERRPRRRSVLAKQPKLLLPEAADQRLVAHSARAAMLIALPSTPTPGQPARS